VLSESDLRDPHDKGHFVVAQLASLGTGKGTQTVATLYRGGDGDADTCRESCGSQNTNGEVRMSDEIDRALSDPSHPIYRIIILALLILAGGTIASDTDIIGLSGI